MMLLPRPGVRNQKRLTRTMQLILLGIVVFGLLSSEPKAIVNGSIGLAITFLPAVL